MWWCLNIKQAQEWLCGWRGKSMALDSVMERWTELLVKLQGVWFGPDIQVEKDLERIDGGKVTAVIQSWFEQKLTLLGRTDVVRMGITSVILYRLNAVTCSNSVLTKLERNLVRFLWKGGKPLVKRSICRKKPLEDGLRITWLKMRIKVEVSGPAARDDDWYWQLGQQGKKG